MERQQFKQNKYIEKVKRLSKSIKKTSRLIGYNAKLLAETSSAGTSSSPSSNTSKRLPQLAKRSAHFETTGKEKQRKITQVNSDSSDNDVVEQIVKTPVASMPNASIKSRVNVVCCSVPYKD